MLIYEKKVDGTRKLFGTKGSAPSANDEEVKVNGETFDFVAGKYFYMPPGGIKDNSGNEVVVSLDGEQIIPPAWADAGEASTDYDEYDEVWEDESPAGPSDNDERLKEYTEQELTAMTKATILEIAGFLGYSTVTADLTKAAMITAFLAEQAEDTRPIASDDEESGLNQ